MATRRLVRSCLFVPADRPSALTKAFGIPSLDAMIVDMEDAVGIRAKSEARANVVSFLESLPLSSGTAPQKRVVVRVNCPLTTPFGEEDLAALSKITSSAPFALLLPKAESRVSIEKLLLSTIADKNPLWLMIETAKGCLAAHDLAEISQVECLVFGSNDFTKDIRAKLVPSREPLLYAMSRTVLAARAAGKLVIDGVHMNVTGQDTEALRLVAEQGRAMGFDGKSLIHPNQIDTTNAAFSPSASEIEHAQAVVIAWGKAQEENKGVCVVDGKLIENLHYLDALETLRVFEQTRRNT